MNNETEKLDQRMKRSTKHLMIWTFMWVSSLALVAFGPKFIWDFGTTFTLLAIFLNIACGYKMIMANKNHLLDMDEMQRKIQLEAMAISLGVSMVFGAVYGLLENVKMIEHAPNMSNLLFVMAISYGVSIFVGSRRYA
jgi:uncharacterized membrane protein